jgi:prepilin-type N-terminal cleavage/methylation domain-containing protein
VWGQPLPMSKLIRLNAMPPPRALLRRQGGAVRMGMRIRKPSRMPRRMPRRMRLHARTGTRGFTIVEMVVVMVLIGVFTAMGMARFADREPFAAQGVADQIVSGLRVAQATAVAQRRSVYVVFAASPPTMSVCLDAACTQPLVTPAGDATWLADTSGLTLSAAAAFNFGPDGAPSLASQLQLQVLGSGGSAASQLIKVETGSGFVHAP